MLVVLRRGPWLTREVHSIFSRNRDLVRIVRNGENNDVLEKRKIPDSRSRDVEVENASLAALRARGANKS